MEIKIVKDKISIEEIKRLAEESFGDMLKAVVDVEKEIMALGGEFHSDANKVLTDKGSNKKDVWGINIYPDKLKEERIEFNSLINIRPSVNNRSLNIEDVKIRNKIRHIVDKLII